MTFTQQARKLRTKDNNIFEIFRLFEKISCKFKQIEKNKILINNFLTHFR